MATSARVWRSPVPCMFFILMFTTYVTVVSTAELYPFGDPSSSQLPDDDDVFLTFHAPVTFTVSNKQFKSFFVNYNGFVEFGSEYYNYNPQSFPLRSSVILVAVMWEDIDITNGGDIWIQSTRDNAFLQTVENDVNRVDPLFQAHWAAIVSFDRVAPYAWRWANTKHRNTFQMAMVSDLVCDTTYAVFNYKEIIWAGPKSQAGYNVGDRKNAEKLPHTRRGHEFKKLATDSNINIPGKWIVRIDWRGPDIPQLCRHYSRPDCTYTLFTDLLGITCNLKATFNQSEINITHANTSQIFDSFPVTLDTVHSDSAPGTTYEGQFSRNTSLCGLGPEIDKIKIIMDSVLPKTLGKGKRDTTLELYPKISINNGPWVTNGGSSQPFKIDSSIEIRCVEEGGTLGINTLTLDCGGKRNVSIGVESSISLNLTKELNNELCVCRSEHPSGCYNKTTVFTLVVQYGPSVVTAGPEVIPDFILCPGNEVLMNCKVPVDNVNPSPITVIKGVTSKDILPVSSSIESDMHWFNFTFSPIQVGITTARCVASNMAHNDLQAEDEKNITVFGPPANAPSMTVNSGPVLNNGSSQTFKTGEHVDIKCVVEGGLPDVNNVNLSCGGQKNESVGTESSLYLDLDKEWNQKMCVCRAEHEFGCYDKITVIVLNVQYPPMKAPNISVNNGAIIANGSTESTKQGVQEIKCIVEGGNPAVSKVILNCGNDTIESNGAESVFSPNLAKEWNEEMCVCHAEHITGYYHQKTVFTLIVQYGPNEVIAGPTVIPPFNLCLDDEMSMYCQVPADSVNPSPTMVIKGVTVEDILPVSNFTQSDMHWFNFTFSPTQSGITTARCVASNSLHSDQQTQVGKNITVWESPLTAPNISLNNGAWLSNGTIETFKTGDSVEIRCEVEGGFPDVNKVILYCGSERNETNGTESSLYLDLDENWNQEMCVCQADHVTGCYHQTSVITLNVQYGPNEVIAGPTVIPPFNLCLDDEMSMYCQVPADSVNPSPTIVIKGVTEEDILPVSNSILTDMHWFNFTFSPIQSGITTARCVATNVIHSDLQAEVSKNITVWEHPMTAPNISLNNGAWLSNGTIETFKTGDSVEIRCEVEGGFPDVNKVILYCGSERNETNGTESSLYLDLDENWNQEMCVCQAEHVTGCYHQTSVITLNVQYGPNEVIAGPTVIPPFNLCLDDEMSMYCQVPADSVNPSPTIVIKGVTEEDILPVSNSILTDMHWFNFTFSPIRSGITTARCVATNVIHSDLQAEVSKNITVWEHPMTAPNISLNNGAWLSNGTIETFKTGDSVEIRCEVEGGFPDVNKVILYCGSERNETNGTESSLYLDLDENWNQEMCVCQAEHVTGCYHQTSVITLNVQYGPNEVIAGPTVIPPFNLCLDDEMSMYCQVPADSVNPSPTIVIKGVTEEDILPVSNFTQSDMHWFNFTFRPVQARITAARCVATNIVHSDLQAESNKTFHVFDPVMIAPNISVNNGPGLSNGTIETFKTGDHVEIRCLVEGGYPELNKVILNCGSKSNKTKGTESSLYLDLDENWNQKTCVCQDDHVTNCFHLTSLLVLNVQYGPNEVIAGPTVIPPFNLCLDDEMSMYCKVPADSVNPSPTMVIKGVTEEDILPVSNFTQSDMHWFNFTFRPIQAGITTARCVASNVIHSDLQAMDDKIFAVHEPPEKVPNVSINNGAWLSNGTIETFKTGDSVEIRCEVEGGFPDVNKVILYCGSERNETNGTESSLYLDLDENWNQEMCVCQAEHVTGCYNFTTVFILNVQYGPNEVIAGPTVIPNFNLCPGEKMPMYCQVPTDSVNPFPTLVIKGVTEEDILPVSNFTQTDMYWFNFTFRPIQPGITTARCVASNVIHSDLQADDEKNITVFEPPMTAPNISINKGSWVLNNSVETIKKQINVEIRCEVEGGYPNVNKVILSCGNEMHVSSGIESSLYLDLDKEWNQEMCMCRAEHITRCYHLITVFTLDVQYGPYNLIAGPEKIPAFNLCPGEELSMYCKVPKESVNPLPTVVIKGVTEDDILPVSNATQADMYQYNFLFRPIQGGITTARCEATNIVHSDFQAKVSKAFTVFEPPRVAPNVSFNNGSWLENGITISIKNGETAEIMCSVEGGHPAVRRVMLHCGNERNETNNTETSLLINVNKELDQDMCVCQAEHISGCYHHNTSFKLNVLYVPSITNFTIQNHTDAMEVVEGANATFVCEAEGNPAPINMSIIGLLSGRVIDMQSVPYDYQPVLHGGYRTVEFFKVMECFDTDTYACVVDNGVGSDEVPIDLSITLCPLELWNKSMEHITMVNNNGLFTRLPFDIMTLRQPTHFTLSKIIREQNATNYFSSIKMDPSQYTIAYNQVDLRYGQVVLSFLDLEVTDSTEYMLTMENGHGNPLDVHFTTNKLQSQDPKNNNALLTTKNLIIVATVGAFCLFLIILFYGQCHQLPTASRTQKALKKERKRNEVSVPKFYLNEDGFNNGLNRELPSQSALTQKSTRLWRQNVWK